MTFSILDHIEKLNHLGRGRYNCPVCNGSALTINKKTGAYRCHSGECESRLIREAIAPLPKDATVTDYGKKPKTPPKPKAKPVYIAPGSVTLGTLPGDRTYPQRIKGTLQETIIYDYGEDHFVRRIDYYKSGGKTLERGEYDKKDIRPYADKNLGKGDRPWDAYRIDEAIQYAAGKYVAVVEGEKCVEAMRWIGIPAITFQGGSWTDADFSRAIAKLKGKVNGLVIIPDHDEPGYKKADQLLAACASHSFPCLILNPLDLWRNCPEKGDVADWIKAERISPTDAWSVIDEAIAIALDRQQTAEPDIPIEAITTTPLKPHRAESRRIHSGYKNLCYAELFEFLEDQLGDRLQFDMMRREMLLDGELFRLADELKAWFYSEFGETANENDIYKAMVFLAKKNSFDPVVEDLERCHREAQRVRIDNLAARYFGHDWESMPETTEDEINEKRFAWMYNRCIEMWLISAVARQFETRDKEKDPTYLGCQADSVLILQGGQGRGKSTWFKYLSKMYFNDSISDIQATNSLMAMHANWIIELAEIDGITSKKDAASLKHYLTVRQDEFRAPYARKPEKHNRRSIFCGTVNPSRFLLDDENRRFWTVPVLGDIDLNLIQSERDGIWAAAMDAYLSGARWYPNAQEKEILKAIALEFSEIDPWHELIESYMSIRTWGNANEILEEVLKFEPKECKKGEQMRVTKILTRLGFTDEKRVRVGSRSIRARFKPLENSQNNKKVGTSGTTSDSKQGSDVPTPVPTPVPDFGRSVQNSVPSSEMYRPNLSEVGTSESPPQQGLQGNFTDLPTFSPLSPSMHSDFKKGDVAVDIRTNDVVEILALPEIGVTWVDKSHLVKDEDGHESYVPLRYLKRYGV